MESYYLEITRIGLYLYIALLVLAAIFDIWKYIIPNVLSVALIGLFVVVAAASPFPINWWSHLGAAAAFFAVGIALYAFKILGAGDIKLITSVSLFAGFEQLPVLILGGERDPVGGTKGLERLASAYRDTGHRDLTLKKYDGGRHEMLNETNRDEVTSDVLNWVSSRL